MPRHICSPPPVFIYSLLLDLLYVNECFACLCVYESHVPGAHEVLKGMLDPLKLEL